MKPAVDKTVQDLLISKLKDIESHFGCDAISYFGSIVDGNENSVLNIIEELVNDPNKKDKISLLND